jgi:hypothetical protein
MGLRQNVLAALIVFAFLAGAQAQAPDLDPGTLHDKLVPTVSYELVYTGEKSAHYAISVDTSGDAAYLSYALAPESKTETVSGAPYVVRFTLAQTTCQRIFDLARQVNDFSQHGGIPSDQILPLDPTVAYPGASIKTLSYSYGPTVSWFDASKSVRNSFTYAYPTSPALQQLTSIFEDIAHTIEQGDVSRLSK